MKITAVFESEMYEIYDEKNNTAMNTYSITPVSKHAVSGLITTYCIANNYGELKYPYETLIQDLQRWQKDKMFADLNWEEGFRSIIIRIGEKEILRLSYKNEINVPAFLEKHGEAIDSNVRRHAIKSGYLAADGV